MPSIAKRGINMPSSPIRRLETLSIEAKRKGKKIYHLNIGQPDIKTPPSAIKAIKNIDLDIIAYSPSAGYESYRKKLVDYYKSFQIDIGFDDLMITTGGSEALLFSM